MSDNPAQQVLSDLLGYLESMETQSGAVLQFLKEKGIATDEQLAPYLEQAANASSVKWRAARVRMEHLFSAAQPAAQSVSQKSESAATKNIGENKASEQKTKAQDHRNAPMKMPEQKGATGNGKRGQDAAAKSSTGQKANSWQQNSGDSKDQEKAGEEEPQPTRS
jgi:hypothetical protein